MLTRYESIRQKLEEFLTAYSDIETTLPRFSAMVHIYLNDFEICLSWEDLINQGKTLIREATAHAWNMLQDQATIPVIDAVKINAEGEVTEELALPLFPVVHGEEATCFFKYLEKIAQWHRQVLDFLAVHGIVWDEEQKRWCLTGQEL